MNEEHGNHRIRVLRIIARMNVGGPALQVVGLTDGLDADRFDQRLLVGAVETDEADYLELRAPGTPATRVTGLGRAPRPLDDLRALTTLVREMRRFRPHIVHTHTAKAGVLGRTAAMIARVPARVHTFHGHLLHGYFSPRTTEVIATVERTYARFTDRLLAVGSQVRDDLLAAGIGKPTQYHVMPPGVALPEPPDRGDARQCLGIDPDVPLVAFVARLTQVKRPDRFIEMAAEVARRLPHTQFIVVGEGELLDDMRRRAEPIGDRVHFLGWRSDVEMIYRASDVVALTSDNEGMPVSLIEAASVGCPAVTTHVGSAAEVVLDGATGFVRDPNPAELADATERLLADEDLRRRFGENAREHAQAHFSRDRLVSDTAILYERLAEEKGLA